MKLIDAAEVIANLSPAACIELMADTQRAISNGGITIPLRSAVSVGNDTHLLVMPGSSTPMQTFGAKLLSIAPHNAEHKLPVIQGYVLLFEGVSAAPIALVEAASLTAIRTAAASALATRTLARPSAHTLAILGCGVQATSHLDAVCQVRDIEQVWVWGRNRQRAEAFCVEHQRDGVRLSVASTVAEAVADADVVCAVTAATRPILEGDMVAPGCHVNLVGAHQPDTREAASDLIARARVYTEITEFALAEAGDLLLAVADGGFTLDAIVGEIGDVLLGNVPGRQHEKEITVYKNLGNVAQDIAAARYVYDQINT
jgi:ornithine cyclodeaminase